MTKFGKVKEQALIDLTLINHRNRLTANRHPGLWSRLCRRWREIRDSWKTQRALEQLDDHMLEDIGVDPLEFRLYRPKNNSINDYWISRF